MGFKLCKTYKCMYRQLSTNSDLLNECIETDNLQKLYTLTTCTQCRSKFDYTYYYCDKHYKLIEPMIFSICIDCRSSIFNTEKMKKELDNTETI